VSVGEISSSDKSRPKWVGFLFLPFLIYTRKKDKLDSTVVDRSTESDADSARNKDFEKLFLLFLLSMLGVCPPP